MYISKKKTHKLFYKCKRIEFVLNSVTSPLLLCLQGELENIIKTGEKEVATNAPNSTTVLLQSPASPTPFFFYKTKKILLACSLKSSKEKVRVIAQGVSLLWKKITYPCWFTTSLGCWVTRVAISLPDNGVCIFKARRHLRGCSSMYLLSYSSTITSLWEKYRPARHRRNGWRYWKKNKAAIIFSLRQFKETLWVRSWQLH